MSTPLITKYRPQSFAEVIGNETIVRRLETEVNGENRPHAYLFTGPSGLGKTTLARIIANVVQATVLEIDAASHSGVDDTRQLVEMANFRPLNADNRMFIIDECHSLSKVAWQPLLKLLEDPPDFLYVALCTTELEKVPDAIRTRCYPCPLKFLKPYEIEELLITICELESWQVSPSTFQAIVQASTGQPRKALSILQAGYSVVDRDELAKVIAEVDIDTSPLTELIRFILAGGTNWERVRVLLEKIDESDILASATRYITAVIVRSSEKVNAYKAWRLLNSMTQPRSVWDGKAQFVNAVCEVVFSDNGTNI